MTDVTINTNHLLTAHSARQTQAPPPATLCAFAQAPGAPPTSTKGHGHGLAAGGTDPKLRVVSAGAWCSRLHSVGVPCSPRNFDGLWVQTCPAGLPGDPSVPPRGPLVGPQTRWSPSSHSCLELVSMPYSSHPSAMWWVVLSPALQVPRRNVCAQPWEVWPVREAHRPTSPLLAQMLPEDIQGKATRASANTKASASPPPALSDDRVPAAH